MPYFLCDPKKKKKKKKNPVKFLLNDLDIPLELLMKPPEPAALKQDHLLQVNQMIPQRHLVLVLCLIDILVEHLDICLL